ncbi:hypothetical protein FRC08_005006 [Ceratobasidium sp. 394]|nr:hypothetical protein FRC08_005006 [Ceratobasidium sp. 394]
MFSRLSAFLSLVVTTMLVFFAPLIAGLIMVSVVFVSSILYAADAISATLVRLTAKLYSRIAARLPSISPALVVVRGLADTWVPVFVEPLKSLFGEPFRYRRLYFVIDILVSSLAVLLSHAVDTESFECLRVSFLLAYLSTTYAFATRSIPPGAGLVPTTLGVGLIPIFTLVIVTLDLRWIMYHPSSAIVAHLLLLIVGLVIYDHQVRIVTCSRSSQPCATLEPPDELPTPDPPAFPRPRRTRFRNVPKQGAKHVPKKYTTAELKGQTQVPNQIADHDNQLTSTSVVIRPKTYPTTRPTSIQGPTVRLSIEAPPPSSAMDASDDESVPTCARLMEMVAQRNNWPKPSAPKYELIEASSRLNSNQAGTEGEELWRKYKWYLPVPIVPDRERTPYSFCSRRSAEKWPTEWSGVRERERTPYSYRPRSSFKRVGYVEPSDEPVGVGIRERTRTPYQIVAYKEWVRVLRPKLVLALPAPQGGVSEASAELPAPLGTSSGPTEILESGSDDNSSGPLTPSDPAPILPSESLDYPSPAAPVTGKRARECDLSDLPSKRHRGGSIEPLSEVGSAGVTETLAADDSGNDSTSSSGSTFPDLTSSPDSTSSADSSFGVSSPPRYTPLKRAHDDSSLDMPSKCPCRGRKPGGDTNATWMRQDAFEDSPTNLDHAPLPLGIHPVNENNQSDATLLEDLPGQQSGPDNLAASATAVGHLNATAPAAFAPVSGSSADSFAPPSTSFQQPIVLPPAHGFNSGPHLDAPQPIARLGHTAFSGLKPASSELLQLDAETEILVDQAVGEVLQDTFAMDHDAPEHTSGEPIQVDLEPSSAPNQEGSRTPMEISGPVLGCADELPRAPFSPDHPMRDGRQISPVDTPEPFTHPASDLPDTSMSPTLAVPPAVFNQANSDLMGGSVAALDFNREAEDALAVPPGSPAPNNRSTTGFDDADPSRTHRRGQPIGV